MNKWVFIFSLLLLQACGDSSASQQAEDHSEVAAEQEAIKADQSQIEEVSEDVKADEKPFPSENQSTLGLYVGDFIAKAYDEEKDYVHFNKITIAIDSIGEKNVFGHSVVAGNNRPFSGAYEYSGTNLVVTGKEPGDDRYDGTFSFTIFPQTMVISGEWKANDPKLPVSEREFTLEKKAFAYDPNLELPEDVGWSNLYEKYPKYADQEELLTEDVLSLNASNRLLKKEDVENMYKGDLEVIRNAIYARHGYSFKNRKMRFIFDKMVDWYMPVSTDIRKDLTDIERKNADLIKRYEQHAARYYDSFGR